MWVGPEFFFGIVLAFHNDIILSVILHLTSKETTPNQGSGLNLIGNLFVAVVVLVMIFTYGMMAYTVYRLTNAYLKYPMLEISDMKDERFKFWIEDKNVKGNFFQRHYSLVNMMKDLFNIPLLYVFYYNSLVYVILITVIQIPDCVFLVLYPPYKMNMINRLVQVTQFMFLALDVLFLINILGDNSISVYTRYYGIGFSMMAVVIVIFVVNFGWTLYFYIRETIRKRREEKEEKEREEKARANANSEHIDQTVAQDNREDPSVINPLQNSFNAPSVGEVVDVGPDARKLSMGQATQIDANPPMTPLTPVKKTKVFPVGSFIINSKMNKANVNYNSVLAPKRTIELKRGTVNEKTKQN